MPERTAARAKRLSHTVKQLIMYELAQERMRRSTAHTPTHAVCVPMFAIVLFVYLCVHVCVCVRVCVPLCLCLCLSLSLSFVCLCFFDGATKPAIDILVAMAKVSGVCVRVCVCMYVSVWHVLHSPPADTVPDEADAADGSEDPTPKSGRRKKVCVCVCVCV